MSYPPHDPQDPLAQAGQTPPPQGTHPDFTKQPTGEPTQGKAPDDGQAPQYGQQPPSGQAPGYGTQGGYGGGSAFPVTEMAPPQQRLWACLAHLSGLVTALVLSSFTAGIIPFGFVGPLVIFLVLRERGIFVRRQALEALNFQILVAAVWLVVVVLTVLVGVVTFGFGLVLIAPVAFLLGVAALIFQIIAAVKANQGVDYKYPVNWRLVK